MPGRECTTVSGNSLATYWSESSRPLVSLVFVAPMLVAYEGGLMFFGPGAMRNGADMWLRQWLESIGFGQYFLLPVLTCGILLGWHHIRHEQWRVGGKVLLGMVIESFVLGALLLCVAHFQRMLFASVTGQPMLSMTCEPMTAGHVLPFLGAGIYEELLFRLLLVPVIAAVCRCAGATPGVSLVSAVIIASVLFAAAHYRIDVNFGSGRFMTRFGEPFDLTSFLFRVSAGLIFSFLFLKRGFGIVAGSHALYDILVSS